MKEQSDNIAGDGDARKESTRNALAVTKHTNTRVRTVTERRHLLVPVKIPFRRLVLENAVVLLLFVRVQLAFVEAVVRDQTAAHGAQTNREYLTQTTVTGRHMVVGERTITTHVIETNCPKKELLTLARARHDDAHKIRNYCLLLVCGTRNQYSVTGNDYVQLIIE